MTQQQGLFGAFLFLVPAVILSGFATPIANMPPLLQQLTVLNPLRHFEIVLRRVFLEGVALPAVLPQLLPIALMGTVTLVVAAWLFRRRTVLASGWQATPLMCHGSKELSEDPHRGARRRGAVRGSTRWTPRMDEVF